MNYEITICRSDGKQTCLELSHAAFDLLVQCADVGLEGAEGNLAHIDDVSAAIDELTEMRDEAEWTPQETAIVYGTSADYATPYDHLAEPFASEAKSLLANAGCSG